MKKEYESPRAEKIQFDYVESVVASRDCCVCGGGTQTGVSDAQSDLPTPMNDWKCSCDGWYASGWGQNCSK